MYHLLEPSIAANSNGTLFVAAHSAVSKAQRAPAYVSTDDGFTWRYLIAADETLPGQEGIIAVDNSNHAWQFDDGAGVMPLYRWCNNDTPCGLNPNAWDAADPACGPAYTERPWIAWGAGKLLLVNWQTALSGYGQVGLVNDDLQSLPAWNGCALGRGVAAGVPAMRSDGTFVVPQGQPAGTPTHLKIVKGTDPRQISVITAFAIEGIELGGSCHPNWGYAAFDSSDRLFLAAASGASEITVSSTMDPNNPLAAVGTYQVNEPLAALWLAASPYKEGAIIAYATGGPCRQAADFHVVHVKVVNGAVVFENDSFVVRAASICKDYDGAAVGPDGRAYLAFDGSADAGINTTPVTIYVQTGGPVL